MLVAMSASPDCLWKFIFCTSEPEEADELAAELCLVAELAELPLMSRKLEVRAAFQLHVG